MGNPLGKVVLENEPDLDGLDAQGALHQLNKLYPLGKAAGFVLQGQWVWYADAQILIDRINSSLEDEFEHPIKERQIQQVAHLVCRAGMDINHPCVRALLDPRYSS